MADILLAQPVPAPDAGREQSVLPDRGHRQGHAMVFVRLKANKTAASAQAFLKALHKACPIRINKLLTDNGKKITDSEREKGTNLRPCSGRNPWS